MAGRLAGGGSGGLVAGRLLHCRLPAQGPLTFSTCATAASPDQQQRSVGKVPAECTREVTALDPGGLCRQLRSGTKGQAEPARTGRGPFPARRGRSPAVSKDGQLRTANGRHLAGYLRRSSSLVIALPRVDDYLVPGTITRSEERRVGK